MRTHTNLMLFSAGGVETGVLRRGGARQKHLAPPYDWERGSERPLDAAGHRPSPLAGVGPLRCPDGDEEVLAVCRTRRLVWMAPRPGKAVAEAQLTAVERGSPLCGCHAPEPRSAVTL